MRQPGVVFADQIRPPSHHQQQKQHPAPSTSPHYYPPHQRHHQQQRHNNNNNNNNNRHQFPRQNGDGGSGYGHRLHHHPSLPITPILEDKNEDDQSLAMSLVGSDENDKGVSDAHQHQRCHCCPYGFHIDLGFVKYAEDVAAGKEQIQNWSSEDKKRARLLASPSSDRTMLDLSQTTDDGPNTNISLPLNDSSLISKSMADELSDKYAYHPSSLPDSNIHRHFHHQNGYGDPPRFGPQHSILKNTNGWGSSSNVPLRANGMAGGKSMASEYTEPMHRQHQSRYHQHPAALSRSATISYSTSAPSPPINRRFPLSMASDTSSSAWAGISSPLRTSTPRVNEEVQQIFAQRQFGGHRTGNFPLRSDRTNGSGSNSAPSSPVPKNFHTAIAQSMAHLKRSPSKASASASFSKAHAHTSLSTLSGIARNAVSTANMASPLTIRHPYLEMGRRQRVLSPEPHQLPSLEPSASSMLRKSNMQNRTLFHNSTSAGGRIPYRSRGASTPSSLDLGNFASVRRQRFDADICGDSATLPSSAQLMRSLSPPIASPTIASTTPHWRTPPPIVDANFQFSAVQTQIAAAVDSPPPLPPSHAINGVQRSIAKAKFRAPAVPIQAATVVRSSGTQTLNKPHGKEIGISTEKLEKKRRHTKETGTSPSKHFLTEPVSSTSIGVDTSDLEKKPPPPPPPPKPTGPELEAELQRRRDAERMAKLNKLSAEFQYCLGHEPEHKPGEQPQFMETESERSLEEANKEEERNTTDRGVDPIPVPRQIMHSLSTSTSDLGTIKMEMRDAIIGTDPVEKAEKSIGTESGKTRSMDVQTDNKEEQRRIFIENGIQTDTEWLEIEFSRRLAQAEAERREKRKRNSVERSTETDEEDAPDQFIMITCNKCEQRSSVASDELFEKIIAPPEEEEAEGKHEHHEDEEEEDDKRRWEEELLPEFVVDERTPIREIEAIIEEPEEEEQEEAEAIKTNDLPLSSTSKQLQDKEIPSIIEEERTKDGERRAKENIKSIDQTTEVEGQQPNNEEKRKTDEQLQSANHLQQLQNVSPLSSDEGLVLADGEEEERDLDMDRISVETDVQTVICVDANRPGSSVSSFSDARSTATSSATARNEALRKMLTEPQRYQQPFQRDAGSYRSYRTEKGKANDLEYITERHKSDALHEAEPSTPCSSSGGGDGGSAPRKALKETITLKKSPPPTSGAFSTSFQIPDPIPARIPRPKFAKYSPNVEFAETADEEAEASDRLTPLRSEMRALSSSLWGSTSSSGSPRMCRAQIFRTQIGSEEGEHEDAIEGGGRHKSDEEDGATALTGMEDASSTSSEGARTYEMSEEEGVEFELSTPLRDALETVNEHLLRRRTKPEGQTEHQNHETEWAHKYVQHEWLKLATKKNANAELVEQFIDALETYSTPLMTTVVNMCDQNGNTALHYAVSNENFDVVSVLLDSKVCQVDEMNKAGYSALMLGALCELHNETECAIIQRLFQMGNVNAKAVKHAQTALMLAASHGRVETTSLLLSCGADVNIQDVDGSTALMCAAEHGQKEIVKILLKRPNIDASLTDCDNQTALSIAVENQHRDIGVLIYAHLNFSRLENNDQSVTI